MSVTSSSESSALEADADPAPRDARDARQEPRLNQPVRALVAVAEVALAGVAVWLAFRLWSHGITEIQTSIGEGRTVTLTRYHGDAIAAAIGLGTLASLFLLDAVRQCVLAVRARPVRAKQKKRAEREQETTDVTARGFAS
ncbi:hypothetical protein [Haloechinothrix salitolerans]|uniref:Uncharacterized protein n=1 Tax=Haloechinothrix salitolerans TaxID=926830 RepID=A0ABW2CB54_9PSEU